MPRRKKQKSDPGAATILVLVAAIVFLIPTLTTYLLWRKYKKIPDGFSAKRTCFINLILVGIAQYLGSLLTVIGFFSDKQALINTYGYLFPLGLGIIVSIPFIGLFCMAFGKFNSEEDGLLVYEEALREILTDGRIGGDEIRHLQDIISQNSLPLDVVVAKNNLVFMDMLYETAKDLNVDSEELQILNVVSGKLNIDSEHVDYANEFMGKVNTVKRILDGDLSGVEPPPDYIPRRGEKCLFFSDCELYENVTRSAFVGASASAKNLVPLIGQLLNPRVYAGTKISYDKMKRIDSGVLVITDKRIAFVSDSATVLFLLNKILGIDVGPDGIQINRSGKKKKEVFKLGSLNKEIAVALLVALLKER